MVFLERFQRRGFLVQHRMDTFGAGQSSGHGGDVRDPLIDRCFPQIGVIILALFSCRGIHDQIDLSVYHGVIDIRTAFLKLFHCLAEHHIEFERIHPFTDGNGRTGRFWHTLILSRWHEEFSWIPIETVVRERQNEYYSALAESNKRNNSEPFIDFMLESILVAVNGMIAPHATDEPGLSDTEAKVLGMIRIGTFGNVDNASNALGVSERTVIRALDSLREKNLIVREGSRKSGVWRAL